MKFFEVRQDIQAPPERVWAMLTDARKLVAGGMGLNRIDGTITLGARIKVWAESAPNRAFPVRVVEMKPASRMVWRGGMPFGLFTGERQYNLTPTRDGTAFHMREEFTGPLAPLIGKSIPDLTPYFDKFARGLKAAAER